MPDPTLGIALIERDIALAAEGDPSRSEKDIHRRKTLEVLDAIEALRRYPHEFHIERTLLENIGDALVAADPRASLVAALGA